MDVKSLRYRVYRYAHLRMPLLQPTCSLSFAANMATNNLSTKSTRHELLALFEMPQTISFTSDHATTMQPSGGFADAWKGRQSQQADSSGEQQRTVGYGQKEFEQYQARWAQSRAQDREDKLEARTDRSILLSILLSVLPLLPSRWEIGSRKCEGPSSPLLCEVLRWKK